MTMFTSLSARPITRACALLFLLTGGAGYVSAQSAAPLLPRWTAESTGTLVASAEPLSSSSVPAVETPEAPAPAAAAAAGGQAIPASSQGRWAFSSFAVAAKASSNGFGVDIATPLARQVNLRVGGSFTSFTTNLNDDGLHINGTLTLQGVIAAVDYYPFRHSSFHISPGANFYNDTHIGALLSVPAGGHFSLGDGDYTSSASDPIHGTTHFVFGNHVVPRLTVGFGNMIPRGSGHWSVPFEIGFQYISAPTVQLDLAGSACSSDGCGTIVGDPNIAIERKDLENDLSALRVFPVVSIGVSYRFGNGNRNR
ncbi:hypothetical protein FTO74_00520 [Granulicella sp. WH15]|uniref:hypothetical protein n=1 Tax=Granulicella sp. WH15 TaxID=2602070 RepID=UPI0013668874|nr:hypothetical protein [Granulicella sp. WH15]QHN02031.1 hypothetical protein FTO74_00520 [Granulicella sp. WH15]